MIKELDPDVKVLIIRMDRVPYVDQSGAYAMEESVILLHEQGVVVVITGINSQPLDMLEKIDVIPGLISKGCLFEKFEQCEIWLKGNLKNESGGFEKILEKSHEGRRRIFSKKLRRWIQTDDYTENSSKLLKKFKTGSIN